MYLNLLVWVYLLCNLVPTPIYGAAVMSIDLGSEFVKVGIVSSGVPMGIALNHESKRKTPAILSYRDGIRTFGEDAQSDALRFPQFSYSHILDLIGKNSTSHPIVQLYQRRFPYYKIRSNEDSSIQFQHDSNTFYRPEELLAQILTKSRLIAEHHLNGQSVKECVLTVPPYFNQVERRAVLQAAKLANLTVLQLINNNLAVALNFGIFRANEFSEQAQYVLFYDMGASSTTATLVSYQSVKIKEYGRLETYPQVSVQGVGFNRTFGGLDIQLRIRDHFANKFNEKYPHLNCFKSPRALAKLFKEAGRIKTILSANTEHTAQVESVLDDQDFRLTMTRTDLEQLMGTDLSELVLEPIEQALKTAHLTKDVISALILFGGGTRVPKIQSILQQYIGMELGKSLNSDEAAALGAVYKAADLTTGFRVKKFITKDAVLYPIEIVFDAADVKRQIRRTLFTPMNPTPQKKIITFNKHRADFEFRVNYADLGHLTVEQQMHLGPFNISVIGLKQVADVFQMHTVENSETKGIRTHFLVDDSGLLHFNNAELIVEKTVLNDTSPDAETEGTFSKLGSTISKLFGSTNETVNKTTGDNDQTTNTTSTNSTDSTSGTVDKPKIVIHKEPIPVEITDLCLGNLDDNQLEQSQLKLNEIERIEGDLNRRISARNTLETFVIDVQTKLDQDNWKKAILPDMNTNILRMCTDISEWLYDDVSSEADADTYDQKLSELQLLTNDPFARVWEHTERPKALLALTIKLNQSEAFLAAARNVSTTAQGLFTETDLDTFERKIESVQEWMKKKIGEQDKLLDHEPVLLTVKAIVEQIQNLDREIVYLEKKVKLWRPPTPAPPPAKEEEENVTETTDEENVINLDTNSENVTVLGDDDSNTNTTHLHSEL